MSLPIADFWSDTLSKSGSTILVGLLTTVVSFVVGRWWGRYRARKQWESKEFLGRIIVSINSFANDTLKIRTMFERSLDEVFLNPHAVEMVQEAAKKTTPDNPMLPIAKEDTWYLLNFVLNPVAEKFAVGVVKEDIGKPVQKATYAIGLTCEVVGESRIRKVRAMMIRRELLLDFPYMESMPTLENPWHADRIVTLRKMSAVYKTNPEQFLTIEVCV
ncbi:MAG: hypothetical protein U0746_22290 [Gemmataceae bacterium]